ncbi:MAG: DNA-protecting protein DprA [Chloroflexota bacterium]|nr:DNA-protecting protein DprA [Chloroflexota bacterium]
MNAAETTRLQIILALRAIPGVGNATLKPLLSYVQAEFDPDEFSSIVSQLPIKPQYRRLIQDGVTSSAWQQYLDVAQRLLDQAEKHDVTLVAWDSPTYPVHLKLVSDAPALLFMKGQLPDSKRTVACVGTRGLSAFGRSAAERITTFLGEQGWTIVSGLAKGIDTVSHRAALDAGAPTVAILGNGLDFIYPAENKVLAHEIIARGGALLSEQPFGAEPTPGNLVQRDRLQSGMSVATIIFETAVNGGAMRTARFAQKQGRLLVCPVPTEKYAALPSCSGVLELLANAATFRVPRRDAYPALAQVLEAAAANLSTEAQQVPSTASIPYPEQR